MIRRLSLAGPSLADGDRPVTYEEFEEHVEHIACLLIA
jgi:hypothetical protein